MAFEFDLEKVKASLINVGKDVEEFAKNTSNSAKLKYDIHNKETFLEKQYALLGKAYYEAHKDEEVKEQECFASIKEAEEELAKLNAELLKIQGAVECPSCGVKQEDKHAFCSNCGAALKVEEATEEAEVVADVEAEEVVEEAEEEITETVDDAMEAAANEYAKTLEDSIE